MKKTIYTYKWSNTGIAYTGQTDSFSNRNRQHEKSWLIADVLLSPINVPIRVMKKTGKLIIEMFLSDDPDKDEHDTIDKNEEDGWHMLNKQRRK